MQAPQPHPSQPGANTPQPQAAPTPTLPTTACCAIVMGGSVVNSAALAKLGISDLLPSAGGPQTQAGGGGQGGKPPTNKPVTPPDEPPDSQGKNPPDLYRMGNKSSPRVDNVRLDRDVFPDENNTICPGGGGISTFDQPSRPGNWWKLSGDT